MKTYSKSSENWKFTSAKNNQLRFILLFALSIIAITTSKGVTYDVTTTADAGAGSFRQAITDANANAGADIITFSGLGTGLHTITLGSTVPVINETVTIDGYTATSYTANNPKIEIQCGFGVILDFSGAGADGSIVRGLILNKASEHGIRLNNTKNMFITGCWIGLSNTGVVPIVANKIQQSGIYLNNNSNSNTIGGTTPADRNVIGGVTNNGIEIVNTSSANIIIGNYIGLTYNGLAAAQNNMGILINGCNDNIIGGTTRAHRNIISGNKVNGVKAENNSQRTTVKANFIGLDKNGSAIPIPNLEHGLYITGGSGQSIIGGTTLFERNVVSGNGSTGNPGNGISCDGSNGNVIKGNWCGVDSTGLIRVANLWGGLSFWGCDNNIVGGSTQYERNVLSGNINEGLFMGGGSDDNIVIGNYVGVGADGITSIGNDKFGLNLYPDTRNTTVGGSLANANIIAHNGFVDPGSGNTGPGIKLDGGNSTKNLMTFNKIYCNAGRAILITGGGNNGILPPTITASLSNDISGTATPNNIIHVYRNGNIGGAGCDCEAEIYLGTTTVSAGGVWSFTHTLGLTIGVGGSASYVTATQTSLDAPVPNTSALAPCNTSEIMPVELLYFNITKQVNQTALLSWATISEKNNKYFIIERSTDGIHFEKIGMVDGNGNSDNTNYYSFVDYYPNSGIGYYRILQYDFDDAVSYTETKKISFYNNSQIEVYPNPTYGVFNISIPNESEEKITIKILTMKGQELLLQTIEGGSYINKEIDFSFAESGIYILSVQSTTQNYTTKVNKF